jgi:hypothetical protein
LAAQQPERTKRWWTPVVELGVHVLAASGIFIVVALPAVGLEFLVRWLEQSGISDTIITGLRIAEYTIFGGDLVLLIVFVLKSAWRAIKDL